MASSGFGGNERTEITVEWETQNNTFGVDVGKNWV